MKNYNDNSKRCYKMSKSEIKEIVDKYLHPIIFIDEDVYFKEEFKQIKIKDDYIPYLISSMGRVIDLYSIDLDIIQPKIIIDNNIRRTYNNYVTIKLLCKNDRNSQVVHRLVAIAFIKNPDPKHKTQVNHKDGIKYHNYISNLEWVTPKENAQHAERTGLRTHAYGIKHGRNIYDLDTVHKVCKLLEQNKLTMPEIAQKTGMNTKMIRRIYIKKSWTSISKDYNIDKYNQINFVTDDYKKERTKVIKKVCEMIQDGSYTMKEIETETGLQRKLISAVYHRTKYKKISASYDFSKFNPRLKK